MEPSGKHKFVEDMSVRVARKRFKNIINHNMAQDENETECDNESFSFSGLQMTKKKRTTKEPPKQPSIVMKLFDRAVNLVEFKKDTPLYPVARTWIQNKPLTSKLNMDQENGKEVEGDREEIGDVLGLPPPVPLEVDKYGRAISLRISSPLPNEDDVLDINYDVDKAPCPVQLLQNHMARWKAVRQRWKDANAVNEQRYDSSFAVLRSLHVQEQDLINNMHSSYHP